MTSTVDVLRMTLPGRAEVDVAKRLDDLHQMLYTRGGIRPVNAAVEELSKLLLLRIAARRFPDLTIADHGPLVEVLDPETIRAADLVEPVKAAFTVVVRLEDLAGRLPNGDAQPVWPIDEPLRITRADVLAEALEVLDHLELGSSGPGTLDPLGAAFDVFLQGRYDHAGGLGTYLTPEPVATMMAELALALTDPVAAAKGRPVFGDPCCGTGRFLVALLERLRQTRPNDPLVEAFAATGIFGADQSSSAVAKARVNLLSYGLSQPEVFTVADSIVDSNIERLRGSLQLILTNPPFGAGKYDSPMGIRQTIEVLPRSGGRPTIDPALAFVARCLTLLAPDGVLGIVLPDGLVDGPVLRAVLLDGGERPLDFEVEASISLPTATFAMAGTVAKTSAVFLRRGESRRRRVFLARAEHVGYLKQGGTAVPDPYGNDLEEVGRAATAAEVSPSGGTQILSPEPLIAYVDRSDLVSLDPNRLDPAALAARDELRQLGGLTLRSYLKPVRKRRSSKLGDVPFISVLHVDDLSSVDWIEAETYRPLNPGIVAMPGEIIVSLLNPRKMRATVIPLDRGPMYCSPEFGVFAAGADPYGLLVLLQDPRVRAQLAPLGRGTSSSRRRIEPDDVLDVLIPPVTPDWLESEGRRVQDAMVSLDRAKKALVTAYQSA